MRALNVCRAHGCHLPVAFDVILCGRHWKMARDPDRKVMLVFHKKALPVDEQPSHEFRDALAMSIAFIAEVEGIVIVERKRKTNV